MFKCSVLKLNLIWTYLSHSFISSTAYKTELVWAHSQFVWKTVKMNASTSVNVCCICKKADTDELAYGEWETIKSYKAHQFCLVSSWYENEKHLKLIKESNIISEKTLPVMNSITFHCVVIIKFFCSFHFHLQLLLAKSNQVSIADILANDGIQLKEYESSVCYVCHEKNATVFCCVQDCQRAFHVVCGDKEHCLMEFVEPYNAYCDEHHGLLEKPPASWECAACWDSFNEQSPVEVILSCCRRNWFHRRCIRKQAYFSGENMKCPSCGETGDDRASFQHFVQRRGVHIPNRSALYPLEVDDENKVAKKWCSPFI